MTENNALHLKYRPRTLEDVKGNRGVVKSIQSIVDREPDASPHVFLFTGDSGCGKTTLARIMAELMGARGIDIHEINFSSERGIDTTRAIKIASMQYGMETENRAWILDEVQGATKEAQNAMLKILEDTPSHVYFFLCTTDKGKLLKTILNRCTQFEVSPLSSRQIEELIEDVLSGEGKSILGEVIKHIVGASNGCPRQVLVMLDAVIDLDNKEMVRAAKKFKTEEQNTEALVRLLANANNVKWKEMRACLDNITGEVEGIRRGIINYMSKMILSSDNPSPNAYFAFEHFKQPFFNNDKAGLIFATYGAWQDVKGG